MRKNQTKNSRFNSKVNTEGILKKRKHFKDVMLDKRTPPPQKKSKKKKKDQQQQPSFLVPSKLG
jgi:hypothetical protein